MDPSAFNNNKGEVANARSDDKGAQPEVVETLKMGYNTQLFVVLERMEGILVYNITDSHRPVFMEWLGDASDISPEGLIVVEASDSSTGNPLIIGVHEVLNAVAIYEILN